ncbi:MAG TPA: radical SAM family heme chaperone HemW, partial [Thermotoga sp.]|nr:radical SAM family heme chaperone HemW [Thermotoga sp.]
DFVSYTNFPKIDEYFEAVIKELDMYSHILSNKRVKTVYFGGGTPNFVSGNYIEKILEKLEKLSGIYEPIEITLEMNPEYVNIQKILHYLQIGINRVSLGVQAFDDLVLKTVRRPHGTKEIEKALSILMTYFDNVNIDFILGLPMETDKTIERDLKLLEKYSPSHVSLYLLDVDEKTPLKKLIDKGILKLPTEEEIIRRHTRFLEFLKEKNYLRYEISNFAKEGKECIHNLSYWRNEDYLGIGVSSGGHIGKLRYVNIDDIFEYMRMINKETPPYDYKKLNDDNEEFVETVFMSLRLKEGICKKKIVKRFGEDKYNVLQKFTEKFREYFNVCDDRISLSESGFDLSRYIFEELLKMLSIKGWWNLDSCTS